MLLITGRFGMSDLCNFNCAFNVGHEGFFCTRIFFVCLRLICIVAVFSVRVFF